MSTTTPERAGRTGVLDRDDRADLTAVARVLYPHAGLADGPYERAVGALVRRAEQEPALLHALDDGLRELRVAAGRIRGLHPDELLALLAARERTPFFAVTREAIAWQLYDDREVWAYIGYPGASYDQGGYLDRGFDDLSWLPEPRVVESDLVMPETGPLHPTREDVA
jgi:hypothetical protein